jgi:NDP-sugar pyrophosphorylase family protein
MMNGIMTHHSSFIMHRSSMMLKPIDFFDLSRFKHRAIFDDVEHVWDVLKKIEHYVEKNLKPGIYGIVKEGAYVEKDKVYLGKGTVVESGAYIKGPAIIGEDAEIRNGAYFRENVIVGDRCVVGHATEIKNSIILDDGKAPHFNYVGDSVLGNGCNLGAGSKLSNLKVTWDTIRIKIQGQVQDTGLIKFGAIIGDRVEVGCNAVLNPGTLLGPDCLVYPNITIGGYYPALSILKLRQTIEMAERK